MAQNAAREFPEGQTGQIKINLDLLSVNGYYYEVDLGTVECSDGYRRRKTRKLKYPSLSKIMSVLKKTGAKVLRVSDKSKYTIIDYTT